MATARFVSPIPSASVLPSSRVRSRPTASARWSSRSPALRRISPRAGGGIARQAAKAAWAASTASDASFASPAWASATCSEGLEGLRSGEVRTPSRHSPAMYGRTSSVVAIRFGVYDGQPMVSVAPQNVRRAARQIRLETVAEWSVGQKVGQLRAVPVSLGSAEEAIAVLYGA